MDKVQKIREGVVGLLSNHDSALDYEAAIEDVLSIIDSSQEDSVSKVLDDAIEYGKNIVLAELERIIKDKEEAGKNYVFVFSEVKDLVKKMSKKG